MTYCVRCGASIPEVNGVCGNCGGWRGSQANRQPVSLFYSYSHKDESLRRELESHLAALKRSGLISDWYDRQIEGGQDWESEIKSHLESAYIILFLVSADFISSKFIFDVELKIGLERQRAGDAVVVPVILRPVLWQIIPELSRLQALPENGRPVTEWPSHDLALIDVCEGILAIIARRSGTEVRQVRFGASRKRQRILDAALPARVPVGQPSALLVMLRRSDSPGLRAVVACNLDFGIDAREVSSAKVGLRFPLDARGTTQPLNLTIKIESPQFQPKSQMKPITIPPRGDSAHRIFLLIPTEVGRLLVNVCIWQGEELIGECLLQSEGTWIEEERSPLQCIASAALPEETVAPEESERLGPTLPPSADVYESPGQQTAKVSGIALRRCCSRGPSPGVWWRGDGSRNP